jgi:hypothetical protein
LNEDEKRQVHAWFPLIDDGDEPPYPLNGTKSIYTMIADWAAYVNDDDVTGTMAMYVEIDAQGNPAKAFVFKAPNKNIANYVIRTVFKHKFKPATCAGKPCAMKFPFSINFTDKS